MQNLQRDQSYTTARSDIVEMVPLDARAILDVGCSNGALGRGLKERQPGAIVCGIEYDKAFASEASKQLDFVVNADLNTMDWRAALGDRKFDCLIFADVLEHLLRPQECLAFALQHLNPAGCVVVSLPNIRHLSAFHSIFVTGRFPQRDRGIFDRTHLRWFTISDAEDFLSNAGLKIASSSTALRWGDQGGGLINRLLNKLPSTVKNWRLVREFFTYQICFKAIKKDELAR